MKKWTKRLIISLLILLVVFVVSFFALIRSSVEYRFNDRTFDAALWKSFTNNDSPDNPRGQMFDDLSKRHLRKGLSKKDVEDLLGPADLKSEIDLWSYNLGMWSGFRVDYDSLDLKFNGEGRLVKFYRVQH